jgi:ribosomal protein S18 acetylase RimI-like enzyme
MYKKAVSEMFLFEIEVLKNYRQQGVGKSLIQELKNICNQKGIKQVFVVTSRTNHSALNLYETTGGIADNESILFNFFL